MCSTSRKSAGVDGIVETLLDLREQIIPAWLAEWADRIVDTAPTLVGLTCMFDQTIASVALARLIKQRAPQTMIALGGYAVRQPTADTTIGAFDWVDVVCLGEGEPVIEALARASVGELPLSAVPNVIYREAGRIHTTAVPPLVNLDTVPTPDYTDYYRDLAELARTEQVEITVGKLPVENSRGCWWGAIRHCVFCGIHDDDLRFRVKSAEAALATMDELQARHAVSGFRFSDYILPRAYFDTLLPELARRGAPYDITAEIKANVAPRSFALLAAAGFSEVQPGIESFSSRALREMDKGTPKLRNINTLLLGARHGIVVHYNLLYGFPDDELSDYEQLLETLARLTHLDPPSTRLEVQITRYAPLQTDPARFGIPTAMYEPGYQLIFSAGYLAASGFDLAQYCYYFQRPYENSPALRQVFRQIDAAVERWRAIRSERPVRLVGKAGQAGLEVHDSRQSAEGVTHLLDAALSTVLLACTDIRSKAQLVRALADRLDEATVLRALDQLDQLGLVARDGDRALSLVLVDHSP